MYILECADKSYFVGITRNLRRTVADMNVLRKNIYFSKHPERVPAVAAFEEKRLKFREAYAKWQYLREMNRLQRRNLIRTKRWPIGGALLDYILKAPIEELE